ncbi:MAG: CHAD domain-containing protein [Alphaproteobacteria bacterium]|nr:CHAD domain-containing protein [Alphaproteobacteria bacterium]
MSSTELELKLKIDAEAARRLRDKPALLKMALFQSSQSDLRSIYFDTADFRLRRKRASLRVRWDGRQWVQTLKRRTRLKHGLSNPVEIESIVQCSDVDIAGIDDPAHRSWLKKVVSGKRLSPVFETNMRRSTTLIDVGGTGTVEVVIDAGTVGNEERSHEFSEVELELKAGTAHAILTTSEILFDQECVAASDSSKAERGYALIAGAGNATQSAKSGRRFQKPALSVQTPMDEALKMIGRSAADQVLGNWDLLLGSDHPEVPHQLRVGLRRFRTALKIIKSSTGATDLQRLSKDARQLGRIVGRLRNADVLIDDIVMPVVRDTGKQVKHKPLLRFLEDERRQQRSLVRGQLESGRWAYLKLNCMLFNQAVERALKNQMPSGNPRELSAREMTRMWRAVEKGGCGFSENQIDERHELRKRLKSLRYAGDCFLPLYPADETKRFIGKLKRLQDIFGYLNDVAMANHLAQSIAKNHPDDTDLHKSLEAICEWHDHRTKAALPKAHKRWRNLLESPKFWHAREA